MREAAALMRQDPVVGVFGRILRHAAYDARFVTVGPLVFFSTETGDAALRIPPRRKAS